MVDTLPINFKENEMKKLGNIALLSALSLLVLCLPAVASAQWGGYGRGGNNGGYYGGNIKGTVQSLKHRAKSFENMTDRYSDRNDRGYRGNSADRIEDLADDFAKAADKLEDKYGNGRNLNNSRSAAQRVLSLASRIDQVLNRGGSQQLYGMWNQMRGELNIIARTYGIGYNGGVMRRPNNYPNNRNRRNNNRRVRLPFPF